MSKIKLEVGKRYHNGRGMIGTCVENKNFDYPFRIGPYTYTKEGLFDIDEPESDLNIVAEVPPKPEQQKKPHPGEWWDWSTTGNPTILFCVGINSTGRRLWENKRGAIHPESHLNGTPQRHLEDCTGFHWVPEQDIEDARQAITIYPWQIEKVIEMVNSRSESKNQRLQDNFCNCCYCSDSRLDQGDSQ